MEQLPIIKFQEQILETVEKNTVVVVIGEVGSGKSTQLPQILHRRGYSKSGCIAVTQPRRVAAVSLARRVSEELNVEIGGEVGYGIRFDDRTSDNTLIKYLTDGVLLRESLSDPLLSKYSVIILDEAHERSLNTDILLGLMKRLIVIRASNLKVMITSATLDGEKVSRFFSDCPVVNVPGKLFPVEKKHCLERPKSYIEAALETALDIHVKEPEGDVLIFLTGKDDIEKFIKKFEERILNLEEGSCMDAIVLPLHGSLPPELQVRVFMPAPPNSRRFIVSTNIAETSLTIDGVVYVIDSGFVKQRQYNPATRMYSLDAVEISKVQADQRAGRAGRTRPGKCYRLYPSHVYESKFLDVTVPEIQRSSLAGSVLYLKSLELQDIDILKFDFLDPPSYEALEDALKQLFLIDAIDEDGSITSLGRTMSELPLEPSLSRTLLEANQNGSLSHALTVAAMLSAETTMVFAQSKTTEKKRKHTSSNLPDGFGLGDHIQLLQIYELWNRSEDRVNWCKEHNLQMRSMNFIENVREQLSQIMMKIAKGPMQIKTRNKHEDRDYIALRKALCAGYANQIAERMLLHNGYRTPGLKTQLVQVHPSSALKPDEDGKFPSYVIYHELITTSRPYMRNVCAVEMQWVQPALAKLQRLNVRKLSNSVEPEVLKKGSSQCSLPRLVDDGRDSKILAARERFLARSGERKTKR